MIRRAAAVVPLTSSFRPAAPPSAPSAAAPPFGVATGAVTVASRDVQLNGVVVHKGNWLGLAEGEPVADGETFDTVAQTVLERLLAEPRGVLTLLPGEGAPPLGTLLEAIEAAHPDLELDIHDGGQPHYALLLSAE